MRVRGAAAPTHDIQPAVIDEALKLRRHGFGRLQVQALGIGHARVGVTGDAGRAHLADRAQVVGHELRAGAAIEPDGKQIGVSEGGAESIGGSDGLDGA